MSIQKKVALPFVVCVAASCLSTPAQAVGLNSTTTSATSTAEIQTGGSGYCWALRKDDYRAYGRCSASGTMKSRITAIYGYATRDRHSYWVRETVGVSLSTTKYWHRKPRGVRGDIRSEK